MTGYILPLRLGDAVKAAEKDHSDIIYYNGVCGADSEKSSGSTKYLCCNFELLCAYIYT